MNLSSLNQMLSGTGIDLKTIMSQADRKVAEFDALVSGAIVSGGKGLPHASAVSESNLAELVDRLRTMQDQSPAPADDVEVQTSTDQVIPDAPADEPKTIETAHQAAPIRPEDVEYRAWPGSDRKFAMPIGAIGDIMPQGHPQAGLVYAGLSPGPDPETMNRPLYIEVTDRQDMTPAEADDLVDGPRAGIKGLRLPTAEEIRFISGQPLSPTFGLKAGPKDAYLDDNPLLLPRAGEAVFTETGSARYRPASVPSHIRLVMT